jgi:hypothetical protein
MLAARIPDGRAATAAAIVGAAALLVAAAVHVAQLVSIFHAVPWIGPLFAADAAASAFVALAILVTRRRVAAASGALVSASALVGLALSSTVGFLGWQEEILRPAVRLAIGSELVAVAALAPLALPAPVRASARLAPRLLAGGGLAGIAVLHLAAAGEEWDDARLVFWLFVGLAAACLALAGRLAQGLDRWTWPVVSALAAVPLAGYLVSRATGLPGDTGDVGDWTNSLGLAALAIEVALIASSPRGWRLARTTETTMQSPHVTEITRLSAHRRPDPEPPRSRPVRAAARRPGLAPGSGPRPAEAQR